MHFIQNSWFTHNWIFLLLFLTASISVVAYTNNRVKLFRYSLYSFSGILFAAVYFFLLPGIEAVTMKHTIIPELGVGSSHEERISIFSRIIDFLLSILKHKIDD
jgi:hypothetical protein